MESLRTTTYNSAEGLKDFIHAFEACTLTRADWTHHAHLVMALWYINHFPLKEATERIRTGIHRLNDACGVVTTATSGYHETITRFYIWSVKRFLEESATNVPLETLVTTLLQSEYAEKSFPLRYYSKELLFSSEARFGWVEPDLKPLTSSIN